MLDSSRRRDAYHPPSITHAAQPPIVTAVLKHGRPRKVRDATITNINMSARQARSPRLEELNANLPTLYPQQCRRNQQKSVVPNIVPQGPDEYFDEQHTATAVINSVNQSTSNKDFNKNIIGRINTDKNTVPIIEENIQTVNTAKPFLKLTPLLKSLLLV